MTLAADPEDLLPESLSSRYAAIPARPLWRQGHRSFVAREVGSQEKVVVRVGERKNFTNASGRLRSFDRLTRIEHSDGIAVYHVVRSFKDPKSGNFLLCTIRPYALHTMRDLLRRVDSSTFTKAEAWAALRGILTGIKSLHASDLPHGDLRPENVLKRSTGWNVADYFVTPKPSTIEDPEYLAPEVLNHGAAERASDVYSFARLARRVLSACKWDPKTHINGLSLSQVEWVLEFCERQRPTDRPQVEDLWDFLFESSSFIEEHAGKTLRSVSIDFGALPSSAPRQVKRTRITDVTGRAESSVHRQPELALVFTDERYARNHIVLNCIAQLVQQGYNSSECLVIDERPYTERNYPQFIDSAWSDRLAQQYLLDDSARAQEEAARKRFESEVEFANSFRAHIFESVDFKYTSEVAEFLSRPGVEVSEGDVLALARAGSLLAVTDHNRQLYPDFQFTESGTFYPIIRTISDLFGQRYQWSTLSWWISPHGSLDGASPREKITAEDGAEAIEAAARVSLA